MKDDISASSRRIERERRSAQHDLHLVEESEHRVLQMADRMRAVAAAASGVIGARSRESLRTILEDACREVIPFDAFFMQRYDPATHTFQGFGGRDAGFVSPQNIVSAAGTPGERVVRERRSLLTLRSDDPAALGAHLTGTGRRSESVIRSPILSANEVLGVLSIQSYTPDLYTEEDVQVAEVIASLAATAIENLRLADDRRAAEEALAERERQLREAQRIARLGSWRWTIGSDRVQWSDEMFRAYGLSPEESGVSFDDFVERIHPDDRPMLLERIEEALRTGEPYEFLHRVIRPDGTERVLLARGEVQRGGDGAVLQMFGSGQDVTEAKIAEEQLRASEESYRTIFELASDAIFVHDIETGAILDANRKACEMHGCTLEELKELGVGGISDGHPPYDAEHAGAFVRRAAEGEPQRFEWLVRRKSGERLWVEVSLHRVRILGEQRVLASVRNIDERKTAEAELTRAHDELEQRIAERTEELAQRTRELGRAEQRFRAIVEASPMPLLLSSVADGTILYANDRLETLLGAPPGSLVGQKTPEFYFDPTDRPRVIATVQRQGFVRDLELRIKRFDGTGRWVSLSVQRLDYDGQEALATALIDITERKQTEQALRASEESYRGLFDNLTELVYVQALDGRFLNVNDAVLRAYGYSRDEIVGKTPEFLAAPGLVDVDAAMENFQRAAAGEPQRFEWWGRRNDGSIFLKDVALKRSTYFGEDVVIAVARDISDRVEAEAALRRSEEQFRRLIENASDLISIVDVDGVIRYESPAVTRILGYDPDERVGKNIFDFLNSDDVAPAKQRLQTIVEHPDVPEFAEFCFRHKDGSCRHIEAVGMPLNPASPAEGIILNSRDITERKRADSTLRMQKTLLEAQGEASIDGILVVSQEGKILSYNQRFVEMWNIPPDVVASRSDEAAIQAVVDQLADPDAFQERVRYLYEHPFEKARDEITLRSGSVFDRYSGPVMSSEGDYYGRIWFFRDMTAQKRHEQELEQARREADGARLRASRYARSLERELEFGRQIQQGLLPAALPESTGWEIAVRFHPVWQVAGDFYDAFELPSGHIGLIIADVSGKGVGAALFMALFQSLLRASAERAGLLHVGAPAPAEAILSEAVTSTNSYITRVHRHAHMFASVFFGLLNPESGSLHYVNAGHEMPVVARRDGTMRRLETTGPALGLLSDASFVIGHTVLTPGDVLVAFTDGVTEARSDGRDFFTEERLLSLMKEPVASAAQLLDRIEEAVHHFVSEAAPSDDLTLLAIRRADEGGKIPAYPPSTFS